MNIKKYILQLSLILLLITSIASAQISGISGTNYWYLDGTTLKPIDPTWTVEAIGDVESVGDCTGGACLDGTSDGGTYIKFYDAQGAGQLINGNLTVARVWTMPDATGTVALTSNLSSYLPLAGGTLTGNLLFTDNTLDIGASGATRPRTGYFGTSVISPLFTGALDGTVGATTPTTGVFTTATVNTSLMPDVNDGANLGLSGTAFSDLFLAEGGIINWDSSDIILTQTGNILALDGGDLALGVNNLTMTGSLGATGAGKLTKVWSVDAEFTNLPTINGGTMATALSLSNYAPLANPTFTGTVVLPTVTLGGVNTLSENASIALDPAGSADEKWSGTTVTGTAGATLAVGDLIYLDVTATEWLLTDADAAATAGPVVVGICVLAANDGQATVILLNGTVRSAAFPASIALGAPVYISTTAGDITATQPTGTDDVIRVMGWTITAEPNSIYFNPSPDYITHI